MLEKEEQYYLVLAEVSVFQTVWLVPKEDSTMGWTDEMKQARPFLSYEEAQLQTEEHLRATFEFIGSYKIIAFTKEELENFLIPVS